jgi:hypothetical protein
MRTTIIAVEHRSDETGPGVVVQRVRWMVGVIAFVRWFVLPRRRPRHGGRLSTFAGNTDRAIRVRR